MSTVLTDDQAKKYMAANIQRMLDVKGWSQADLARATGETKMKISNILRGQHDPGIATLARIAEVFDASIDRLVMPPPENFQKTA